MTSTDDSNSEKDAALASLLSHLSRHGTLKDLPGTLQQKTALLKTAEAKRLIAWVGGRLTATERGKQYLTEFERRGFTILELSIVLVIIGLIVGGVLVGQDLIQAAKLRRIVSEIEKLQTAVNTFQVKYNCLPGDCATASTFGLTGSGPGEQDGNGNGMIAMTGVDPSWEGCAYAFHLYMAGLAPKPITCTNAWDSGWPLPNTDGTTFFHIWSQQGAGQEVHNVIVTYRYVLATTTAYDVFTTGELFQIDTKLDDGLPKSGRIGATGYGSSGCSGCYPYISSQFGNGEFSGSPTGEGAAGSTACIDNTVNPNTYNLTNTTNISCSLSMIGISD